MAMGQRERANQRDECAIVTEYADIVASGTLGDEVPGSSVREAAVSYHIYEFAR